MSPMPFAPTDVQALGWSLLHFLWQGAAAALALAVVDLGLRRAAPATRYRLAAATLAVMVAAPVVTFRVLRATPAPAAAAVDEPVGTIVPRAFRALPRAAARRVFRARDRLAHL